MGNSVQSEIQPKTYAVLFNREGRNIAKKLTLYGKKINYVDSVRYLGVIIDNRLKWTEHITPVANKCDTLLRTLVSKTKGIYGPKPKLMKWVYTGVVRVKLTYAAMIWEDSSRNPDW